MNEKLKKLLPYIISATLSVLTFLYLLFTYVKYDLGLISATASGYDCLNLFDTNISGILLSVFLIVLILVAVALLVFAILGMLKELKVISFQTKNNQRYNEWGLLAYAILSGLIMVFTIAYVASNTMNKIGIGSFIGLFLGVGVYVLYKYLHKKQFSVITVAKKNNDNKNEKNTHTYTKENDNNNSETTDIPIPKFELNENDKDDSTKI